MRLFDGTAARQLPLLDDDESRVAERPAPQPRPHPHLRGLMKDCYRELDRRRRRAQIAARKYVEDER